MNNKGLLLVICGPSGVGKGTVCQKLSQDDKNIFLSVSATTRAPRPYEINGGNYFFLSKEEFIARIEKGDFLEWAEYCNNYYGTPKETVNRMLKEGKDVVLEIDVQGAKQIQEQDIESIYIFLIPPSIKELYYRLKGRGTETKDVIEKRLNTAKSEYKFINNCDYVVMNENVLDAVSKIKSIIIAEKCRVKDDIDFLKGDEIL
jgi:guanylate kinase